MSRAVAFASRQAHWGLETAGGQKLPPRSYSTGATQQDAVSDIVRAFEAGATDVFFHANLGSGKSLIALHVIANMGRGLVVVPTKNLQDQYAADYEGRLVIRHPRERRALKIRVMKGRGNFHCSFHNKSAASPDLVCTKDLPSETPRWRAAMKCPDWSPVYKAELAEKMAEKVFIGDENTDANQFQDEVKDGLPYEAIFHDFVHVQRGSVCPYYAQYDHFRGTDAVVMNQAKWEAETSVGRKPRLDVEVFDEADHFLDSLGSTVEINRYELDIMLRRYMKHERLPPELRPKAGVRQKRAQAVLQMARKALANTTEMGEVDPPIGLIETLARIYEGMDGDEPARRAGEMRALLEHPEALYCTKQENRYMLAIGEPSAILRTLLARSGKKRLWMSATLPDKAILRDVFGFHNPVIIQGETAYQGKLFLCTPDNEASQVAAPVNVRWEEWYGRDGRDLQVRFDRALTFIKKHTKGPTAYIIHGKGYLESIKERSATSRHVLKLLEKERGSDETLSRFMAGQDKEVASTRMNRGVDFKGELCRDLVLIKFPLPDISDPKLQAIRKKFREKYGEKAGDGAFWRFARDTARRVLLQQIGRGLRSPDDWVRVWSTDQAIHDYLNHRFPDKAIITHVRVREGQRKLPPV